MITLEGLRAMNRARFTLRNIQPVLFALGCVAVMITLGGCAADPYSPSLDNQGKRYNSKDLAKDWRSQFKNKSYPRDNDADYYYTH